MRAIAEKAGVSTMTVSLALRDHASIPESTRTLIKAIASELGYRPDPVLRAFHAYRHNGRLGAYQGTLGWVDSIPDCHELRAVPAFEAYFTGALDRAKKLGYKLEKLWLGAPNMTEKRMTEIVRARSIEGLLFPPQPNTGMTLGLDWSRFSVVSFGYTLACPRFHSVCNDHYQSVLTAMGRLNELGYARIGFAVSAVTNDRIKKQWLAAYLVKQQLLPKRERIEPLLIEGSPRREVVGAWLKKNRPDAVVAIDPLVAEAAQAAGIRVPDDVAFVLCGDSLKQERFACIDENSPVIGATAVDMLAGMLQRNERGIPEHPIRMLIEGVWVDGPSVLPSLR